jgi:hypothetical protein
MLVGKLVLYNALRGQRVDAAGLGRASTARRSNSISAGSTETPGRLRADHQIDATDPAEAFGPRSEIHRIA